MFQAIFLICLVQAGCHFETHPTVYNTLEKCEQAVTLGKDVATEAIADQDLKAFIIDGQCITWTSA